MAAAVKNDPALTADYRLVRPAELTEIREILSLGERFLHRINPEMAIDFDEGRRDLRFLMASKTGTVLITRDRKTRKLTGVLAGQVMKQAFVKSRYATDLAFVVERGYPIHAVALARHFIHWARSHKNCREVVLNISSGLDDADRLGVMYEKLGLRKVGGCFSAYFPRSTAAKQGVKA